MTCRKCGSIYACVECMKPHPETELHEPIVS